MSYSITDTHSSGLAVNRRQNALSLVIFLLSASALPLRFAVSPQLLDRVVDYTGDSGPTTTSNTATNSTSDGTSSCSGCARPW